MMRPGQYLSNWRAMMIVLWVGAVLATAAIWAASTQIGLATWWLGPRGDRMPVFINLAPFVGPVGMVVALLNNLRWLPWFGVLAAAPTIVFGIIDLGEVAPIGRIELAIGIGLAVASAASSAGTYRRSTTGDQQPTR